MDQRHEQYVRKANRGQVERLAPAKEGLPLITTGLEFDRDFFRGLLQADPEGFRQKVVDLLAALCADVGCLHNDSALLLEDVVRSRGSYSTNLPGDRSCREYDHWLHQRANAFRIIRAFKQSMEKEHDEELKPIEEV